jgi:hypothetical protein
MGLPTRQEWLAAAQLEPDDIDELEAELQDAPPLFMPATAWVPVPRRPPRLEST